MPQFKLTYFDGPGRAELIRLIFAAAKVDFEDHRFGFDEWSKIKPEMPFNAVPVLYIDGTPLCESGAIVRYLATEYGFNGANSLQAAYIEMVCGVVSDVYSKLPFMEKDKKVKDEKTKKVHEEDILPVLKKIEDKFTKSKKEFLIGDKLSYADLKMTNNLILTEERAPQILSDLPSLCALRDRVRNMDGIKQYLKNRPISHF